MKLRKKVIKTRVGAVIFCAALVSVTVQAVAAESPVRMVTGTINSSSLEPVGSLGKNVTELIREISGGSLILRWTEPGALVPPLQLFDAVARGSVQVAWHNAGYAVGKDPAFAMYAAVPFGPRASEYLGWMYYGGGVELMHDLYAKYGIHAVLCGITPPEGGGWFNKEINAVEDLKGLKMRILGLGARVMSKLGVSTQLLAAGQIYNALSLGTIDATEFAMPNIDLQLGFDEIAKYYYFPGWHQQSTLYQLLINQEAWKNLSETHKAQVRVACRANITEGIALGSGLQAEALKEIKAQGVEIRRWPDEVLKAMKNSWQEVTVELNKESPAFAKAWHSYQQFHENYKVWEDLGYLK